MSFRLLILLSVHYKVSVRLFVHPFVHPFVHLPVHYKVSVRLFVHVRRVIPKHQKRPSDEEDRCEILWADEVRGEGMVTRGQKI